MTDETQRTLITAGSAIMGTIIGGALTAGVQGIRDSRKEAKEALVAYHMQRREALREVLREIHQADVAIGEARSKWLLTQEINEDAHGQIRAIASIDDSGLRAGSSADLTMRRLHERLVKTEMRCDVANEASIKASHDYVQATRSALAAAYLYGDYPFKALPTPTLVRELELIFGKLPQPTVDTAQDVRLSLAAMAQDVGNLAAWETDAIVAVRSRRFQPPDPVLHIIQIVDLTELRI